MKQNPVKMLMCLNEKVNFIIISFLAKKPPTFVCRRKKMEQLLHLYMSWFRLG